MFGLGRSPNDWFRHPHGGPLGRQTKPSLRAAAINNHDNNNNNHDNSNNNDDNNNS